MSVAAERAGGRAADALRPVTIEPGFMSTATGSALISCGGTRVICTASIEQGVPRWRAGKGLGWLTAEYGMLPASTGERKGRDAVRGRQDGRTIEIQRLIGRSLRGVVDYAALGEFTDQHRLRRPRGRRRHALRIDHRAPTWRSCSAAGAWSPRSGSPRCRSTGSVAAVSCGIVGATPLLDLDYREDSSAEVDANVVMTGDGGLLEVQATAEGTPLQRAHLDDLLVLAAHGIEGLRGRAGGRDRLRGAT